jgi:tellurite resistance protein TerC
MARFNVPRVLQQQVLYAGIVLALVMRGVFIAGGAILVDRFTWIFYVFGAFLLYTSWRLMRRGRGVPSAWRENLVVRLTRRLPVTKDYHEARLLTVVDGRLAFTPLIVVFVAIGTADLIFALDSIPAIFGLTKEPYLALMGLRQLYFLLGSLLDRLQYLSTGLSLILGFIGIKLVLEALHDNSLPFIHGGQPVTFLPKIPVGVSLVVIGLILAGTAAASLAHRRATGGRLARRPPRDEREAQGALAQRGRERRPTRLPAPPAGSDTATLASDERNERIGDGYLDRARSAERLGADEAG